MNYFPYLLLCSILFLAKPVLAQENGSNGEKKNCYDKYARVFEARGAKNVEEGVHENVVITVRKGNRADCYMGKAKVEEGKVVEMHLLAEDSTYEKMEHHYKHDDVDFKIINGVTRTKVTEGQGKLVNILFIEHINPKPKDYIRAPEPDFD